MSARKTAEDANTLQDMLRENGLQPRCVDTCSPHEVGRIHLGTGQIAVLYKTGTVLLQGRGEMSDLAALCRADGWKCKG